MSTTAPPLSRHLLRRAASARAGLVPAVHRLAPESCDVPHLVNASVPADRSNAWQTPSGAVAANAHEAEAGAIAEALERLAAAQVPLPLRRRASLPAQERLDEPAFALFSDAQRHTPGFQWPLHAGPDDWFAPVWCLHDNRRLWVPQELVGLGPRMGSARLPSTSSGLAAQRAGTQGPWLALLRAVQELLERDALTVTWLCGLGGREIALPEGWRHAIAALDGHDGQVHAFDLTQRWNPHPVVAVAGSIACDGRPRPVLGMACRATRADALHKAAQEWAQSLAYVRHLTQGAARAHPLPTEPAELRRFDEHAAFYTLRPELWPRTALLAHRAPWQPPPETATPPATPLAQLQVLQAALRAHGIQVLYRDLTTTDVAATGLVVMRALSPQLSALHADERAPFLGGRTDDAEWRYPGARRHTAFPNPLPHPLG
ncbi:MAG: YcaO-like family protein [Pseudomonadota bacterium]|nr:YcaO-like family protein [Pseudomonadota bacterium]